MSDTAVPQTVATRPVLGTPVLTLAVAAFAAGLSEFIVIGLLSQIAAAFDAGLAQAGMLVAVYALGIGLGAPVLTVTTLGLGARGLSAALIGGFALVNLGCAGAPSFALLLVLRALSGALHGAYFSIASASLPTIFDVRQTPMALALMFTGLTVAMVLGVPIGMALAASLGWQAPFLIIAAVAGLGALALPRVLPAGFGTTGATSMAALRGALGNGALLRPYSFTILGFGGGFVFFTFAEPWLAGVAGLSAGAITLAFGAVGLGALIGNIAGGALPARLGRPRVLTLAIAAQVTGLLLLLIAVPAIPAAPLLALWAVGAFATAPLVQGWAIELAQHANARIAASLNVTAFNLGLSASAFLATRQIAADGLAWLPLTAAAIVASALPLCLPPRRARPVRVPA